MLGSRTVEHGPGLRRLAGTGSRSGERGGSDPGREELLLPPHCGLPSSSSGGEARGEARPPCSVLWLCPTLRLGGRSEREVVVAVADLICF
jgi:hypothetical protein